ncbi:DNA integrity scanning protein DisA nucleotide-binding domain protein [Dissulfurispira sp.]|uniref:DNA integrity scanning protein DisA nucleotide-binding domain protein n=1 Tax=Dissulfurispira sp. TaxID=2817609 RepID=UPI002FD91C28
MKDQRISIIESALNLVSETKSHKLFLFLNTAQECRWFLKSGLAAKDNVVLVIPKTLDIPEPELKDAGVEIIRSWAGNQSRFSRIKYAFLHGVLQDIIHTDSKVVCVLGPWGKSHLDTVTIHDLALSWSEDFPFEPQPLVTHKAFNIIMAVVDIALDIGALGREGKPVGTTFVIGDAESVLKLSHQAVFNPFKGYPKSERIITRPEVVESIKELAKLDGAFVISDAGVVEAAGRHLDARSIVTKQLRGLGSRHRAAAGITRMTKAVSVVVSESTGRVTIFEKGHIISTLEPVISRRLV